MIARPGRNPHKPLVLAAAALLTLGPAAVAAQTVRGTVIEAETGSPVVGAIVMLLDSRNVRVGATLSDEAGAFTLGAPAAGTYTVLIERIGIRSLRSPPMSLARGDVRDDRFAVATAAANLSAVVVSGSSSCDVRPEVGKETAELWDAVRKALTAAVISQEERLFEVETSHFERQLHPRTLTVERERRWNRSGVTEHPFVSVPAEELAERGWIYSESATGETVYNAPDAHTLLSDAFLDGHCFAIRAAPAEGESLAGLGFHPAGGNAGLPDIEGVLWLERESSELRYLEYSYVRPPIAVHSEHLGGRVEFQRLPTGQWIVSRWAIRMPQVRIHEAGRLRVDGRFTNQRTETLVAIQEDGGEVTAVRGRGGAWDRSETATLVGSVFDSTEGAPLAGASVFLSGTQYSATTSGRGAFRLEGLPAGKFVVSFAHPRLDLLGVVGNSATVVLRGAHEDSLALWIPSLPTVIVRLCPDSLRRDGLGVLRGVVRDDLTGKAQPHAGVRVTWSVPTKRAGKFGRDDSVVDAESDASGYYTICGVPTDRRVKVARLFDDGSTGRAVELRFAAEAGLLIHELRLAAAGGRVVDAEGNSGETTVGPVAADSASAGTSANTRASPELTGFEERRRKALGRFIARAEFENGPAVTATDVLRRIPGVRTTIVQDSDGSTRTLIQVDGAAGTVSLSVRPVTGTTGSGGTPERVEFAVVGAACSPTFYLDGTPLAALDQEAEGATIDDFLRASDIEAVEVYRNSEAPLRFRVGPGGCGVIVIWTRLAAG